MIIREIYIWCERWRFMPAIKVASSNVIVVILQYIKNENKANLLVESFTWVMWPGPSQAWTLPFLRPSHPWHSHGWCHSPQLILFVVIASTIWGLTSPEKFSKLIQRCRIFCYVVLTTTTTTVADISLRTTPTSSLLHFSAANASSFRPALLLFHRVELSALLPSPSQPSSPTSSQASPVPTTTTPPYLYPIPREEDSLLSAGGGPMAAPRQRWIAQDAHRPLDDIPLPPPFRPSPRPFEP